MSQLTVQKSLGVLEIATDETPVWYISSEKALNIQTAKC